MSDADDIVGICQKPKNCANEVLFLDENAEIKEQCVDEDVNREISMYQNQGCSRYNTSLLALNNKYHQKLLKIYGRLKKELEAFESDIENMKLEYGIEGMQEIAELAKDPMPSSAINARMGILKSFMKQLDKSFKKTDDDDDTDTPIVLTYKYVYKFAESLKVQCTAVDKLRELVVHAVIEDVDQAIRSMPRDPSFRQNQLSEVNDLKENWPKTRSKLLSIMELSRKCKYRVLMYAIGEWEAPRDIADILKGINGIIRKVNRLWELNVIDKINKKPKSNYLQKEVKISKLDAPFLSEPVPAPAASPTALPSPGASTAPTAAAASAAPDTTPDNGAGTGPVNPPSTS